MERPITTLIVDDELHARESMAMHLERSSTKFEIVGLSTGAQNALELIIDRQPELVFLDINMPQKDGFWLAKKLRKLQLPVYIIFVTAHDEYAVQAFRYAAFDFLTKPVIPEVLADSIKRYLEERAENNFDEKMDRLNNFLDQQKLEIYSPNGFRLIPYDSIIYCQHDQDYTSLFLSNGNCEVLQQPLDELEKKIGNSSFVRVSKSTLVNIMFVEELKSKEKTVILTDALQKFHVKVSSSGLKKLQKLKP